MSEKIYHERIEVKPNRDGNQTQNRKHEGDADFLLISPDGRQLIILSDAGGAFPLADSIVRLSDTNSERVPAASTIGNGANSRLARGWALRIETPETLIVNSVNDVNDGVCSTSHCSLRKAVEIASSGSEIKFGAGLGGGVVVLGRTALQINKRLTISALDFNGLKVSVSGNGRSSVIFIDSAGDLTLNNIGIIGGLSLQSGAGIFNRGKLTMNNCLVKGNRIIGGNTGLFINGAEIASFGILRLTTTVVEQNDIESDFDNAQGAGIFLNQVSGIPQDARIISCIIRNNRLRAVTGISSSVLNGGGLALLPQTKANGNSQTVITGAFGYFRFAEVAAGQTVVVAVSSRRYEFQPQIINVIEDLTDLNFIAGQQTGIGVPSF